MLLNSAPIKTVQKSVQVTVQRKARDETDQVPGNPSLCPFQDFVQIASVNVAGRLYGSTLVWYRAEPRSIKGKCDTRAERIPFSTRTWY